MYIYVHNSKMFCVVFLISLTLYSQDLVHIIGYQTYAKYTTAYMYQPGVAYLKFNFMNLKTLHELCHFLLFR